MEYEKNLIKEFKHWEVYVHPNQYYLGRIYIWAKREVVDFFDMTDEEIKEYFEIGRKLKEALNNLFSPDLYNYATLANVSPHLHTHIIPRYKDKREFAGMEFVDKRWGKNYAPYNYDFKISEKVLMKIKNAIKEN